MSLRLSKQTQRDGEGHSEQEDDENLNVSVLVEPEQRHDGCHEQDHGQTRYDEAREDVDSALRVQSHQLVRGAGAVAFGDEEALQGRAVSLRPVQHSPRANNDAQQKRRKKKILTLDSGPPNLDNAVSTRPSNQLPSFASTTDTKSRSL